FSADCLDKKRCEEGAMDTMTLDARPSARVLELTPAIFGKMLLLVWAERNGRSVLPSREELSKCLLESVTPPRAISAIMHVDSRGGARRIQEFTYYMAAAQEAGLLRRMNPSYVAGESTIDRATAAKMLGRYVDMFPTEVAWLQKRIAPLQ